MKNARQSETEQSKTLLLTAESQHGIARFHYWDAAFSFFEHWNNVSVTESYRHISNLILSVVLLRVPQHSVAKPADVPEGSMALVSKLLQPQHRAITAVRKWCLQQLENLQIY